MRLTLRSPETLRTWLSILLIGIVFAYGIAREFGLGDKVSFAVAVIFLIWVALEWRGLVLIARVTFLASAAFGLWVSYTGGLSPDVLQKAVGRSAFFTFFLMAMDMLRAAAMTSPMVLRTGRTVVDQPPGRRYAVMTLGAHVFSLLLNLGSVTLLATMTRRSIEADTQATAEVKEIRLRRMTLAVIRGFTSYTLWGPTAVTAIFVTSLIPGFDWVNYAPYGLAFAVFYMLSGWMFDRLFYPRGSPQTPVQPLMSILIALAPMTGLTLSILGVAVAFSSLANVRLVGALFMCLPIFAALWIAIQYRRGGPARALALTGRKLGRKILPDLTSLRSEITLLSSAAFIATVLPDQVNTEALAQSVAALGLTEGSLLALLTWIVALCAPIGLNPLITVAVGIEILLRLSGYEFAPHNLAIAGAIGWALASAGSPISASLRIVGRTINRSPVKIGFGWNLGFTLFLLVSLTCYQLIAN